MSIKEMYEVHGDGPYFIYNKKTQQMVSMVSFTTEAEALEFVKKLNLLEPTKEKAE